MLDRDDKCFACGKPFKNEIKKNVVTCDGQKLLVGVSCYKKILEQSDYAKQNAVENSGYLPRSGFIFNGRKRKMTLNKKFRIEGILNAHLQIETAKAKRYWNCLLGWQDEAQNATTFDCRDEAIAELRDALHPSVISGATVKEVET
jgi:DNA-directed RNA polymerase subunit RPC12/RpoP